MNLKCTIKTLLYSSKFGLVKEAIKHCPQVFISEDGLMENAITKASTLRKNPYSHTSILYWRPKKASTHFQLDWTKNLPWAVPLVLVWGCFQGGWTEQGRSTMNVAEMCPGLSSQAEWKGEHNWSVHIHCSLFPNCRCSMSNCFISHSG